MNHKQIEFYHVKRRYRQLNLTIAELRYFRLVLGTHAFVMVINGKRKRQS